MAVLQKLAGKLIRNAIAVLLGTSAIALLLFGPRGIDSPPKDKIIVNYWEKWSGKEGEAIQSVVDDFNNTVGQQKGIFVRCLPTSDPEQRTLVSAAGGVSPDIAGLYDFDVSQFAARSALMPLDDLAAAHGITEKTYKKVFWDECHYNGHLYGLISTGLNVALFYNKTLFANAGLDPEKPPQTIAELDADAAKIDKTDANGGLSIVGYLPTEPGYTIQYTPFWFGTSFWDDSKHRFNFDDPRSIEGFRWVQSYPKRLGPTSVTTYHSGAGSFDSPQNPFFAQTLAMEQQGTFLANFIKNNAPQMTGHWAACAFPSNDINLKDVTYCTSDVLCIPRGAPHPKEAFEFLAYMTTQAPCEKLAVLHGKISPLRNVSANFMKVNPNPYIQVFDHLAASPNAHATPPVPMLPEVNEEVKNFVDRLCLLKVSPEEGCREVQEHLQQKYDSMMEELKLRSAMN